jgi:hypothetical protein
MATADGSWLRMTTAIHTPGLAASAIREGVLDRTVGGRRPSGDRCRRVGRGLDSTAPKGGIPDRGLSDDTGPRNRGLPGKTQTRSRGGAFTFRALNLASVVCLMPLVPALPHLLDPPLPLLMRRPEEGGPPGRHEARAARRTRGLDSAGVSAICARVDGRGGRCGRPGLPPV